MQNKNNNFNNDNLKFKNYKEIDKFLASRDASLARPTDNKSKHVYVRNFYQSAIAEWLKDSIKSLDYTHNNAVTKWLQDLRIMSENECLCVLQAKSLLNKSNIAKEASTLTLSAISNSNQQIQSSTSNSKILTQSLENSETTTVGDQIDSLNTNELSMIERIQSLRNKSNSVSVEFTKIIRRLDKSDWTRIPNSVKKLVYFIKSVIKDYNLILKLYQNMNNNDDSENLNTDTEKLLRYTETQMLGKKLEKRIFHELLSKVGQSYEKFYNVSLRYFIRLQLDSIIGMIDHDKLKAIFISLIELCLQDEEITKMLISENCILVLFDLLCDPYFNPIIEIILRTISTLCSCAECIDSMEKVSGVGYLTDILCNENADEWIRTEAAGCIAQLTSPTLDLCHRLTGFIENMEDLISALTILCRDASDTEVFLIGTAALAHMTFMDSIACEFLHTFGTARIIIENCFFKNHNSIFIKDQVTTILANMALLENCRNEIVEFNGLNLLVDYLNEKPTNYMTSLDENGQNCVTDDTQESELTACERVQQKAAIALNRFAKHPQYATMIVELGCLPRLVTLCRNSNERNNSDAVLVACLAALRQLALVCDSNLLRENDVQMLIRPRLRESFLMCSSAEESYV